MSVLKFDVYEMVMFYLYQGQSENDVNWGYFLAIISLFAHRLVFY